MPQATPSSTPVECPSRRYPPGSRRGKMTSKPSHASTRRQAAAAGRSELIGPPPGVRLLSAEPPFRPSHALPGKSTSSRPDELDEPSADGVDVVPLGSEARGSSKRRPHRRVQEHGVDGACEWGRRHPRAARALRFGRPPPLRRSPPIASRRSRIRHSSPRARRSASVLVSRGRGNRGHDEYLSLISRGKILAAELPEKPHRKAVGGSLQAVSRDRRPRPRATRSRSEAGEPLRRTWMPFFSTNRPARGCARRRLRHRAAARIVDIGAGGEHIVRSAGAPSSSSRVRISRFMVVTAATRLRTDLCMRSQNAPRSA